MINQFQASNRIYSVADNKFDSTFCHASTQRLSTVPVSCVAHMLSSWVVVFQNQVQLFETFSISPMKQNDSLYVGGTADRHTNRFPALQGLPL